MNREQARQYILDRGREYFQRDGSGKGYICPVCGSGSGRNGTGITTKDGKHFTCWAGCFTNADVIDIIGLENSLDGYSEKLQKAAEEFNITIEGGYHRATAEEDFGGSNEYQNQPRNEQNTQQKLHNTAYTTEEEADYTDLFRQAAEDLSKTDYRRGLSLETLARFQCGYVESWRHPKAPRSTASPRLIIPTSEHSYLARYAGEGDYIDYLGKKQNKSKVGKVRIFNTRAIKEASQPIFIVEGEIDAMSIVEVGGEALGLGSIGNARRLISLLENQKPSQPFIIALDNEEDPEVAARVEKAVEELQNGLERLEIPYYRKDIAKPYKDANEALNGNREAFTVAVMRAVSEVADAEALTLEEEREQLQRESVLYSLPSFLKDIEQSKQASFIPTGFSALDNVLDGGLYAGLYIIGAISSLGKTTFCLQVCDQIAAAGHDVLIFSLEMARNELIAKSVSRLTFIADKEKNGTTANAKTTRGILTGTRYADYSQTERGLIQGAIEAYGRYAKNIYITEGVGDVGIDQIREKVQKHIKLTGKPPVVLIDYLQILAPADMRATDKQNTDKAVLELKRLSRDYGIPVIGISSFNRENYTEPVNLTSFKESGAIEYSSDVLLGLQYQGMDYQQDETEKKRITRIRDLLKYAIEDGKKGHAQHIQIKVLKNRNGSKGDALLDFFPMFNYFTDRQEGGNNGGWNKSESNYK